MFGRAFADFDPAADDRTAGDVVRRHVVGRVRRWLADVGSDTDAADAAHVLLGLAQGLALQESAGWLGTSAASIDRRWRVGVDGVLDGFASGAR
jgi:hypothetical protein